MRKAIQLLILIMLFAVAALGQSPAQCRVTKTFYTLSGQPDRNATLTVYQIRLGGGGNPAYTSGRLVLRTDSQGRLLGADGVTVGVDLPQGAMVWLYSGANAQLPQLALSPNSGTQYQVPNKSTAALEELTWNLATIKAKGALLIGGTNGIASQFSPCADGQTLVWDATQALGTKCQSVAGALGYTPVNKAGDTLTGALTLAGAPTLSLHAASKGYVDGLATMQSFAARTGAVTPQTGDYAFSQISGTLGAGQFPATLPALDGSALTNLNAGNLGAGIVPLARISGLTDTQIASGAAIAQSKIANLISDLAAKAPLASPSFTGTALAANLSLSGSLSLPLGSATIPGVITAAGGGAVRVAPLPATSHGSASFYGYQNINAASWSGGIATITTAGTHNYVAGALCKISGVTPSGYNGTYRIVATPTATTFTVAITLDPGSYSAGSDNVVLEPEIQITASAPNVPALVLNAHPQSVPLLLDPGLPVFTVTGGDSNYHNSAFSILADGHTWQVWHSGVKKQFSNGYLDTYTSEHVIAWTSGPSLDPETSGNRDLLLRRSATGRLAVDRDGSSNPGDIALRAGYITATGGAGFWELAGQSSAPSTPSSALRLYADSSNRLSWILPSGFTATFVGSGSASAVYTLPTTTATLARTDAAQTFTGVQTFGSAPTMGAITSNASNFQIVRANSAASVEILGGANGTLKVTGSSNMTFNGGNLGIGVVTPATLLEVSNALQADQSSTADDTRLLLWDVTAGAFRRVTRGTADSCGTGFRCLRIVN